MSGLFPNVDTPKTEPDRLDDLTVTDSAYGNMIPIVFGTQRVGGNIIWATDLAEQKKTRRSETGGKGGGGTQTNDEIYYEYSASFAIMFGEGEASELLRIWMDRKLIYSRFGEALEKEGIQFEFYNGSEDQNVDPTIKAIDSDTPAYRGLCYAVFSNLVLTDYGNRIPQITAEINFGNRQSQINAIEGNVNHPVSWDNVVADWERKRLYIPRQGGIDVLNIGTIEAAQSPIAHSDTPAFIGLVPSTGVLVTSTEAVNPYSGFVKTHAAVILGSGGVGVTHLTETGTESWFITRSLRNVYWFDKDFTAIPNTTWGNNNRRLSNIAVGIKGTGEAFVADCSSTSTITVFKLGANGAATAIFNVSAGSVGFSALSGQSNILLFDHVTSSLIVGVTSSGTSYKLVKVSQTGVIEWQRAINFLPNLSENNLIRGGYLTYLDSSRAVKIKISDGSVVYDGLAGSYGAGGISFCNSASDVVVNHGTTASGITIYRRKFDAGASDTVNVNAIISYVCNRAGLENSRLVTTAITDTVPGYTISKRTTPAKIIEPLGKAFNFDAVETNGEIRFLKRGTVNSNLPTIPEGDFIRKRDDDHFTEARKQDVDLPMEVSLNFTDSERDYERNTATAKRQVAPFRAVSSDSKSSITLPATLTAAQAKNAVAQYMHSLWTERSTYAISLPQKYLYLDPLDAPTFVLGEGSDEFRFQGRILNHDIGANYSSKTNAARQNDGQYASELNAYGGIAPDARSVQVGQTVPFVLDLPLLHDSHELVGAMTGYVTANHYGPSEEWKGAVLYRSVDAQNWDPIADCKIEVGWGTAKTILSSPASYERIDTVNTLDVTMIDGELESVEELEMINGKNSFIIVKENGDTPILQFQNVESLGNNTYRLSNLLRGRRGTQTLDGGYSGGETILFLNADSVRHFPIPFDDRNLVRFYRGSSFGEVFEHSGQISQRHSGRDLIPYPPVLGSASQSDDTITLNWVRQTRVGGEADLLDGVAEVPVSENAELYDLEILDNNNLVVLEASDLTGPTYSYDTTSDDGTLTINHSIGSNMDFESDDSSWTLSGGFTRYNEMAWSRSHTGNYFIYGHGHTSTATQTIPLTAIQRNGISASSTVKFSLYYADTVDEFITTARVNAKIECINASNTVVKTSTVTSSPYTYAYKKLEVSLSNPPTSTTQLRLTVDMSGSVSFALAKVDTTACILSNPRDVSSSNQISFRVYQKSAVVGRGYVGEFLNVPIAQSST